MTKRKSKGLDYIALERKFSRALTGDARRLAAFCSFRKEHEGGQVMGISNLVLIPQ